MNPFQKSTLAVVTAASLSSVASGPARAFDLEDYATTYRATRDAYLKAANELKIATVHMEVVQGILALYGETAFEDLYQHLDESKPAWCRVHDFKKDERAPAFPEVRGNPTRFAVGHFTHADLDYNAKLFGGSTEESYLHFGTQQRAENPAAAVQAFISWFPYADEAQRAAAQAHLDSDLAALASGLETFMSSPQQDPNVFWRFTPQAHFEQYLGVDGDLPVGSRRDLWGAFCDTGADCPATATCADPGYGQFRCYYEQQPVVFPPEPVQEDFMAASFKGGGDYQWQQVVNGVPDFADFHTVFRASRDAYLKAANELKLATGPYKAARDAYVAAMQTYYANVSSFYP